MEVARRSASTARRRRNPLAVLKRAMSRREAPSSPTSVSSGGVGGERPVAAAPMSSASFFWKPRRTKGGNCASGYDAPLGVLPEGIVAGANSFSHPPAVPEPFPQLYDSDEYALEYEEEEVEDEYKDTGLATSMLFQLVFQEEFDEEEANTAIAGAPLGLRIGGGVPTEGTRQRIRARNRDTPPAEEERDDDMSDDLYNAGAAWGTLVSDSEVQHLRRTVWRPNGQDCPEPHTVTMGYHAAWDIGKRGTIAMKQSSGWDFMNPCRLRMFLMNGTEPYSFLTYYTRDKLDAEVARNGASLQAEQQEYEAPLNKGTICAAEVRDAEWFYKEGKLRIKHHREDSKKKAVIIITRLPAHFMDAMIVCIREMEVFKAVTRLTWERIDQAKTRKASTRVPEEEERVTATIGAHRRMTRALVAHSPGVVQSVLRRKRSPTSDAMR